MSKNILALCGSIRKESSNRGLLLAVHKLIGSHNSLKIFDEISLFPHFSPDLEIPMLVQKLRREINQADILLISTPEYIHAVPGVLKNALEWIVSDENFPGKKVGIIIASSDFGHFAKDSLSEILRTMSADLTDDSILSIPAIRSKVNTQGELLANFDPELLKIFLSNLLK